MTDLEAKVALNLILDIGSIRLNKLLEFFGKPENILKASRQDLEAVGGIGEKIAAKICAFKKEDISKEFALAKKYDLRILSLDDAGYPQNLKHIADPPIILYVKGELKEQDCLSIAIVGARRASYYGLENAEKFAADLVGCGFTIVSGMARGIDTSSHRAALKAGGRTIAVIGSGFADLYPPENKALVEKIASCGAVISEFPIQTAPAKPNFPRRNRVISGLSLGVIVVEAARNSGALITADFALEQGREVFALPGKVDAPNSFGTNALIKQGAKLACSVEDILEEFDFFTPGRQTSKKVKESPALSPLGQTLSLPEELLYNIIIAQPLSLDELVEKTDLSVSVLAEMLLTLELKKLVQQLPGGRFIRSGYAG